MWEGEREGENFSCEWGGTGRGGRKGRERGFSCEFFRAFFFQSWFLFPVVVFLFSVVGGCVQSCVCVCVGGWVGEWWVAWSGVGCFCRALKKMFQ